MRLCVFIEPQQGATYDSQLAVAQKAEELGYDGFFRSDHLLAMGGGDGMPGPTDAWITLAGIARETSMIRLGTLVTSATFRLPGVLAISVAQVDAMSNGRVELGLGAGWFAAEHTAYGVPFPDTGERFDRLEEQLAVVTGLWSTPLGERFTYRGAHYDLLDSPALPKPVQVPPPIIVGGHGPKRTPALAARYADEFNVPFGTLQATATMYERVADACAAIGRDGGGRAPIVLSAAQTVAVGRTEAEYRRRAEAIGKDPADLRANGLGGTVDEVVEKAGEFGKAGAQRLFLQVLDLSDLEHLELIAAEVAPRLI